MLADWGAGAAFLGASYVGGDCAAEERIARWLQTADRFGMMMFVAYKHRGR